MKISYTLILYRHIVDSFQKKIFFHIYNGFWYMGHNVLAVQLLFRAFLCDFFSGKKIVKWVHTGEYRGSRATYNDSI